MSVCVGVMFTFKLCKHLSCVRSHQYGPIICMSKVTKQAHGWASSGIKQRRAGGKSVDFSPQTGMTTDSSSQPQYKHPQRNHTVLTRTLLSRTHICLCLSLHAYINPSLSSPSPCIQLIGAWWGSPLHTAKQWSRQQRISPANTNGVTEWPYR